MTCASDDMIITMCNGNMGTPVIAILSTSLDVICLDQIYKCHVGLLHLHRH